MSAPPPDFNRLARAYRWMEALSFGPWLWGCRCAWLDSISARRPQRALILGDGDGRFTARLLRTCPGIRVDAVDASSAMLRALLKRAGNNAARIRIFLADARGFSPPSPPYDLIVTHFFLDCLTTAEVQALAATLSRATAPDAQWVVSDFAVPPSLYGRLIAQPIVSLLYFAFALLTGLAPRTLPDHRSALTQSGFTLLKQHASLGGLLTSELWGFDAHDAKVQTESAS
jgi:ubiquinone/menaquinone biosynthesis C-methylase UbiE